MLRYKSNVQEVVKNTIDKIKKVQNQNLSYVKQKLSGLVCTKHNKKPIVSKSKNGIKLTYCCSDLQKKAEKLLEK